MIPVLPVLIIFILIVAYITWVVIWCEFKDGCTTKISFQQFLNLYSVAPHKWYLCEGWVGYEKSEFSLSRTRFYFSQTDTIRYFFWKRGIEKNDEKVRTNREMKSVIDSWQKDIDRYREEYLK